MNHDPPSLPQDLGLSVLLPCLVYVALGMERGVHANQVLLTIVLQPHEVMFDGQQYLPQWKFYLWEVCL